MGVTSLIYDWDGTNLSQRIERTATAEGVWITYHHTNPISGEVEHKRTWLRRHDGMIFGAGYYSG